MLSFQLDIHIDTGYFFLVLVNHSSISCVVTLHNYRNFEQYKNFIAIILLEVHVLLTVEAISGIFGLPVMLC